MMIMLDRWAWLQKQQPPFGQRDAMLVQFGRHMGDDWAFSKGTQFREKINVHSDWVERVHLYSLRDATFGRKIWPKFQG